MSEVNDFAGQNHIVFIPGQKVSHGFALVCVCTLVSPGPEPSTFMRHGKVREKHLVLLKLAEKALVTSHDHLKPVYTHTEKTVRRLDCLQNHWWDVRITYYIQTLTKVWALSHLSINPHTHPQTKSSLHHGPNKPSTRLAPSNSLSRNKFPGCLLLGCISGKEELFKAPETTPQYLT